MERARIKVVLTIYCLSGVVGAASLPPGDQYSPHQPLYERDGAEGSLDYSNWLEYQQALTRRLEPPDYSHGTRRSDDSYVSRNRMAQKDIIRDLDIVPLAPGGWKIAGSPHTTRNSGRSASSNLDVPENSKNTFTSKEDDFEIDDTFQDQGPGSVEVYKLDLHPENSPLVPHSYQKHKVTGSRLKSKIPKKAKGEEILWKLKPRETSKTSLPSIFRQPPITRKYATVSQKSNKKIKENHTEEVFGVGGVPELQVGCEGLEASEREKRSSEPRLGNIDQGDWDNSHNYQDPVYRESTEPILLRVTPIVLEIEEEEPPSGEVYEEMDELLKLKKLESTSPRPTTKRWNRADIDPVLELDKHQKERMSIETFPERGDLGPKSNNSGSEVRATITGEDSRKSSLQKERLKRDTVQAGSSTSFGIDLNDDTKVPWSPLSQSSSFTHQSGRKLLWVQYPERQEPENQATRGKHHQANNEDQNDLDLWGFREEDGDLSDSEEELDLDKLRDAEAEKRRREYERRRQQELSRRREGRGRQPHLENAPSGGRDVNTEIERIRMEYERQLEEEARARQRVIEESRRERDQRRGSEQDPRNTEQRTRQEEESRRRLEEERRRNLDASSIRRREEEERRREWNRRREEEERRRRLENRENHEDAPSPLTRIESSYGESTARSQQDRTIEEQKLREYIERNRPVDPKKTQDHRQPRVQSQTVGYEERRRNEEHERRRMQEEQRRQQSEELRRRQHQPNEAERQRQLAENQRRQQQTDEDARRRQTEEHARRQHHPYEDEHQRQLQEQRRQNQRTEEERRQMEEERRRDRPESRAIEEERRRRLEEERKLQDYVRRNQPVVVSRRNNSVTVNSSQTNDLQEQRRIIEAARQWDHNRRPNVRTNDGRIHGPSAPANVGQQHHSAADLEEMRRRHEKLEEERRREMNRRLLEEEERRREVEYQRAESRRHEEERKRLEAANRRNDENRRTQSEDRRNSWQDYGSSRHPAVEVPDREAGALRRREEASTTTGTAMQNREDEWRRSEERKRQQQQHREERERHRLESDRNSRNNGHRRSQYENRGAKPRQRGESVRGGHDDAEWRRREHARLNSLPVSARIILRSDGVSRTRGETSPGTALSTPPQPFMQPFGSRGNFNNDIDFPVLTPNRPGLNAQRFPAPITSRPPAKSPDACVWAIVQCCPANNRLTRCFESMGCPGVNWDPNPCRGSLADSAKAQVIRFYEAVENENLRS